MKEPGNHKGITELTAPEVQAFFKTRHMEGGDLENATVFYENYRQILYSYHN